MVVGPCAAVGSIMKTQPRRLVPVAVVSLEIRTIWKALKSAGLLQKGCVVRSWLKGVAHWPLTAGVKVCPRRFESAERRAIMAHKERLRDLVMASPIGCWRWRGGC